MTDADWFIAKLSAEIPQRIHSRDTDDGGNPDLAHAFLSYLTDGENNHWRMIPDDVDLWKRRYLRPMKRALSELSRRKVPDDRPGLDTVLWCLAEHDGNIGLAIAALRMNWAFMWHPVRGRRWVLHALWELQAVYREEEPRRLMAKSESQHIAEAA